MPTLGSGSLLGGLSYLAVGRETTFGTYNTATSKLDFLSNTLKTVQETKLLEQISASRTYRKTIRMGKVVAGDLEYYYAPRHQGANNILQNAFGGTVTSATATGETAGGTAFTHTFEIGSMDQSFPSLNFNTRKGDATNGKVFEYSGVRVNEITYNSELDEALKVTASVICKDSTVTTNDVESVLTDPSAPCLSFVDGRLSVEETQASVTSTSFWHIQNVTFGWNNSLKSDSNARRIGSDVLDVLPVGIAGFTFNATVRFDTTVAYDAMLGNTTLAADIEFLGDTLPTSIIRQGIKFRLPTLKIKDAGDPEISGPDDLLTSEVVFEVLQDDSSASGYAIQAEVTNDTSTML